MAHRHFETSEHAKMYQQFRPRPPQSLIDRVLQFLKEKYDGELTLAIDVGCGSGQNTIPYALHFQKVIGFDVSPEQILVASQHNPMDNVIFKVSAAETLDLDAQSVQLCTAMTAAHWFDLPNFYKEVSRILTRGGVLALGLAYAGQLKWDKDPGKDEQLNQLLVETRSNKLLVDCRPPVHDLAMNKYRDITIPFEDFVRDEESHFTETKESLAGIIGRIRSSSSFQRLNEKMGTHVAEDFLQQLESKFLEIISEDLDEAEKSAEKIFFTQRVPFILLMARKSIN